MLWSRRPAPLLATALLAAAVALIPAPVRAAKAGFGETCSTSNNRLDSNTYAFITDCDSTYFCADNNTCAHKQCRSDIFPFGYNHVAYDELPPMCPEGQFCPDEGSHCMEQAAVGQPCQKDRDEQCALAPNWKDLAGWLNSNGSICLNYTCEYANVTLGQTCINDNTRYTGYTDAGVEYAFIISRDNCANALYCDGSTLQCLKTKSYGASCSGNKECNSYNCGSDGKCGRAADEPIHPPVYSFVLVGLGIVILIVGVFGSLWFVHRKHRTENQRRLEQYWNEQVAYRQSLLSMSQAKRALLGEGPDSGSPRTPQLHSRYRDRDAFDDADMDDDAYYDSNVAYSSAAGAGAGAGVAGVGSGGGLGAGGAAGNPAPLRQLSPSHSQGNSHDHSFEADVGPHGTRPLSEGQFSEGSEVLLVEGGRERDNGEQNKTPAAWRKRF